MLVNFRYQGSVFRRYERYDSRICRSQIQGGRIEGLRDRRSLLVHKIGNHATVLLDFRGPLGTKRAGHLYLNRKLKLAPRNLPTLSLMNCPPLARARHANTVEPATPSDFSQVNTIGWILGYFSFVDRFSNFFPFPPQNSS